MITIFCNYFSADPPLVPVKPPSICAETYSINSTSKQYLKSICFIRISLNYTNARQNCLKNSMQLYELNDFTPEISRSEVFKFFNNRWPPSYELWVRGRKDSNCTILNNFSGNFTDVMTSCSKIRWSVCQFIQLFWYNIRLLNVSTIPTQKTKIFLKIIESVKNYLYLLGF